MLIFWAFVAAWTQAFLPTIESELGWCEKYLFGILEGKFSFVKRDIENITGVHFAPTDVELFEILKDEQQNHPGFAEKDFGWNHGRPDTQYMINLILHFNPHSKLLGMGFAKETKLVPVENWKDFLKLSSLSNPQQAMMF